MLKRGGSDKALLLLIKQSESESTIDLGAAENKQSARTQNKVRSKKEEGLVVIERGARERRKHHGGNSLQY